MHPPAVARALRWGAVPAMLLLVACDAGGSNPFASFETRCRELPASRFVVTEVPLAYVVDETQSVDQLTVRGGNTPGRHLTFGLTTVSFGHQTEVAVHSLDDRAGGQACGTVDVRVRLSMQPVTVYLAEELDGSACARNATLEHERKHVEVFRDVLGEAASELTAELAAAIGPDVQRGGSTAELQQRINARVNDYLAEFIRRHKLRMDERQDAVDSPQEYARVRNACP
jgi:hypothetical protein